MDFWAEGQDLRSNTDKASWQFLGYNGRVSEQSAFILLMNNEKSVCCGTAHVYSNRSSLITVRNGTGVWYSSYLSLFLCASFGSAANSRHMMDIVHAISSILSSWSHDSSSTAPNVSPTSDIFQYLNSQSVAHFARLVGMTVSCKLQLKQTDRGCPRLLAPDCLVVNFNLVPFLRRFKYLCLLASVLIQLWIAFPKKNKNQTLKK